MHIYYEKVSHGICSNISSFQILSQLELWNYYEFAFLAELLQQRQPNNCSQLPHQSDLYLCQQVDHLTHTFSKNQLNNGIKLCSDKAKQLLDDAELLLNHEGSYSHALGLYTFGVEEYGKAL